MYIEGDQQEFKRAIIKFEECLNRLDFILEHNKRIQDSLEQEGLRITSLYNEMVFFFSDLNNE